MVRNVWKTRQQSGAKVNDFVDVLHEMLQQVSTDEFKKVKVTEWTVVAQAIVFLGAGMIMKISMLSN